MVADKLLELAEAEAVWGYEDSADPATAKTLGTAARRLGGGVVLAMRNDPTNYWSKALGFGFTSPVTAELVAEITGFYREHGVAAATLQFAPSVLPPDWDEIRAKEGLRSGGRWLKLARQAGPVAPAETELRVAPVGPADAEEWASVLVRGFGMPVELIAPMIVNIVGRPGWTAYGAWDGDDLVAAASLLITGDVAEFPGASTLPEHRGRGAQSALLAARARRAVDAGATWLSAETGKPDREGTNPSLNNMLRAGFAIRYERENWVWKP